ncbi:MAG: C-type lectin domain-containing protein [Deltaproteobacteria bacterium]|nr:C-type lectin domain-containing protein [Deltaproteobacteria bacterium]
MRRALVGGLLVGLCGCDAADLFGLHRAPDAQIDTPVFDAPADSGIDAPVDAAIDAPPGADCPASYVTVDITTLPSARYRYLGTPQTWAIAQAACAADQIPGSTRYTHLAVINTDNERSKLTAQQPRRGWIGVSDRKTESLYLWVTNEQSALPSSSAAWSTGEPDQTNPDDDCVEMNGVADYAESDCNALLPAWCECDASPIQLQNF